MRVKAIQRLVHVHAQRADIPHPLSPHDLRHACATHLLQGGAGAANASSYFDARYLRPDLGRFTTIDPAMMPDENVVDPQRWNRYSYAINNPLKCTDPDGRWIETLRGIANLVMGATSAVDNVHSGNTLSGDVGSGRRRHRVTWRG